MNIFWNGFLIGSITAIFTALIIWFLIWLFKDVILRNPILGTWKRVSSKSLVKSTKSLGSIFGFRTDSGSGSGSGSGSIPFLPISTTSTTTKTPIPITTQLLTTPATTNPVEEEDIEFFSEYIEIQNITNNDCKNFTDSSRQKCLDGIIVMLKQTEFMGMKAIFIKEKGVYTTYTMEGDDNSPITIVQDKNNKNILKLTMYHHGTSKFVNFKRE